jgi:hypothetical protein
MSDLFGTPLTIPAAAAGRVIVERRNGGDRRRLTLRTFLQGGLTPRRRSGRRATDLVLIVDWHEPHLLFLAIGILLLSVADAFLTLTLLTRGAQEANPVLDYVLNAHPELFAAAKMCLTGAGVLVLVALARATVFRIIRVTSIMQWFLLGYAALIGYEWWLLRSIA